MISTQLAETHRHAARPWSHVFSDVDDTIIRGKSLFGLLEQLACESTTTEARRLRDVARALHAEVVAGRPREALNALYYQEVLAGRDVAEVAHSARTWFDASTRDERFLRPGVIRFLRRCIDAGSRLVFVTGSFEAVLTPLLELLGGGELLAAPLEIHAGVYTGRLQGPPVIGAGKALALRSYAARTGAKLGDCVGIGDDPSDLAFLDLLGARCVPADGHQTLLAKVGLANWSVLFD